MNSFALVHSPLVGPRTWEPVAEVLRARAVPTVVPSLLGALAGGHEALAAAAEGLGPGSWLVVVHSGAGSLVPALVHRLGAQCSGVVCAGVVFVDALLPHPGRSWAAGAPADLVAALRDLVGPDGLLPPWHTWFGPDALAELVPDALQRARLTAEVPRVPRAYLEAPAPLYSCWERVPCAYLRLSDAYVQEEAEAERRGWPTEELPGHHLSAVTDPVAVAEAVLALAHHLLAG